MANYKLCDININNITLDIENPRIPLSRRNVDNENQTLDYLIKSGDLIGIMESIGKNNFFAGEPLLLVKDINNAGKYIVVEGNRRASALKLLQNPDRADILKTKIQEVATASKYKPTEIPSIIFSDRHDISQYLGYRHITGIKNWKALEKARYMQLLYNEFQEEDKDKSHSEICQEIAKSIGSQRTYVDRILEAFKLYELIEEKDFFDVKDLDDETFHFVNLSDSLGKENIKKFIFDGEGDKPNDKHLKEWTEWLFEKNPENTTRLKGTSGNLKSLNCVLGAAPEIIQSFRDKDISLKEAELLSENAEQILRESLNICLHNLQTADRVISKINNFNMVSNFDDVILGVRQLAKKIFDFKNSQDKNIDDDL